MSADIEKTVAQCATCATFRRQNNKQPMIPHEIPNRPWAKVGAYIFSFKDHNYLVVVDYFTIFPEVEQLTSKTANGVISVLRQIFARHGIPETMICDNRPFLSHVMAGFSTEMGFEIVTSSPRYAQPNSQSEKCVGIVKSYMRKAHEEGRDFWMSLLQYRNTPITGAPYSPAQLLMNRKLREKMPSTLNTLKPVVVTDGRSTLRRRQTRQKHFYDRGTMSRASHRIGDNVRVRLHNTWDRAIVTGVCDTPASCVVTTEDGGSYRRNERVLNKLREVTYVMPPESMERDDRNDDLRTAESQRAVDSPTDSPAIVRSPLAAEPGTPTTRRGLVSEFSHCLTQSTRGSRLKSKPRWQHDFEMGVK